MYSEQGLLPQRAAGYAHLFQPVGRGGDGADAGGQAQRDHGGPRWQLGGTHLPYGQLPASAPRHCCQAIATEFDRPPSFQIYVPFGGLLTSHNEAVKK